VYHDITPVKRFPADNPPEISKYPNDQPFLFSHFWFATVQEVLQADWQEVWHSPQPP
jgi:hypothetical protein